MRKNTFLLKDGKFMYFYFLNPKKHLLLAQNFEPETTLELSSAEVNIFIRVHFLLLSSQVQKEHLESYLQLIEHSFESLTEIS